MLVLKPPLASLHSVNVPSQITILGGREGKEGGREGGWKMEEEEEEAGQ